MKQNIVLNKRANKRTGGYCRPIDRTLERSDLSWVNILAFSCANKEILEAVWGFALGHYKYYT